MAKTPPPSPPPPPPPSSEQQLPDLPVTVRTYSAEDKAACQKLYREGLIGGKISENDTGLDIADIPAAYLAKPENHFWVAVNDAGEVVGMIGVQQCEPGTAEVRRLRVRQDSRRRGVGQRLMETAVTFCRDNGYLKVALDTFMDREPAIRLFEKLHFNHSRTRQVGPRELLYFYLDLYQSDGPERKRKK